VVMSPETEEIRGHRYGIATSGQGEGGDEFHLFTVIVINIASTRPPKYLVGRMS